MKFILFFLLLFFYSSLKASDVQINSIIVLENNIPKECGLNFKVLDKDKIKKDYPIINTDEVIGGILMPGDGAADPSGVTHMLAKGARMEGAQIFEKTLLIF